MIRIVRGAEPRGLTTAARNRLTAAAEAFNQHGAPSRALRETLTGYGTPATKEVLYRAQHGKCAWCERYTDFSSSPVEHYRPKDGAWRHHPGNPRQVDGGHYWWLTWAWSNLLFSCARCNDAAHKANFFPLRSGSHAVPVPQAPLPIPPQAPVVDVSEEQPALLDPAGSENPLDHIEWVPGNTHLDKSEWTWTPLGLTTEGEATIAVLKLGELAGRVQSHVRKQLLRSIKLVEQHLGAGRISDAHKSWEEFLEEDLAPTSEFTAFTWHALRHLVPDAYRRKHGLVAPRKPGTP